MRTISIYQVEDTPIGSGGMGQVLRGQDPQGRQVAIKEILPEFASDFEIRTRTEREVEILEILNNTEGIVKVYDRFPINNNFYIVMELVDGNNVEQYVGKYGAMPYERAVRFMMKILEIMQSVHEKDIVHRDMKPSNIMIRNDERVCILDFGIAKEMDSLNGKTAFGTIIGSDGYMSPEQAQGLSIDHRADIYALGCVFYYMLTGHHAYDTLASQYETESNIVNNPFPRLTKYSKKPFPAKLQEILDHATDKNMMKRYQSCREFRKDLEILLPSASKSHTIISSNKTDNLFITVGREGCDLIVNDDLMKVSRSHLDITYKQFTGGRYYVITDHSSNGTMVNGHRLNRGESENILANGPAPQIFLACDECYPLDWDEVKRLIAVKINETSGKDDGPTGDTQFRNDFDSFSKANHSYIENGNGNVSFVDAIKLFFTRAFDFNGRSRRKEYWYVVLACNLLYLPYYFAIFSMFLGDGSLFSDLSVVYFILSLVLIIPNISLTLRRLHDIGKDWKSLLWLLLLFVPIANFVISILWIIWMATDSEPVENKWGPCPKQV
ncbi:MAG: protein kinase [Prevotellaceae bacterium]|nr:protein kinase [Prevotellaceae bacterium]